MDKGINRWTGNSFFRVLSFKQGQEPMTGVSIFIFSEWRPCRHTPAPRKLPLNALLGIFSDGSRGRDPGGPPPLIFRPKWGPKGLKKVWDRCPPSSQGLDDSPPPPVLSKGLESLRKEISIFKKINCVEDSIWWQNL